MNYRPALVVVAVAAVLALSACGDCHTSDPANLVVRERLNALPSAANLAHRGSGPNRPLSALPENSLAAFRQAIEQGADGVELDVELTADGALLVLHDDTLDRTTTCTGCLSSYSEADARACRLVNFRRQPSDEPPPTLAEAYAALPDHALVNVELKVYGRECLTPTTGGDILARTAAAEVRRLGAADRTLFSSFDEDAIALLKRENSDLYAARLIGRPAPGDLERLAALRLDAVHPFFSNIGEAEVAAVHQLGLQMNPWTVNGRDFLQRMLDLGVDAIITDEPAVLTELKASP